MDKYPLLDREAEDYAAALSAFHRLYIYAVRTDNSELAAIAVLKAIQKLENAADSEHGDNVLSPLTLPEWVREGLWGTFRSLLVTVPGPTPKGRKVTFKQTVDKVVLQYRRWGLVRRYAADHDIELTAAITKLGDTSGGGSEKTLYRAVQYIEGQIQLANELDARDERDASLHYVEARDLVPTQKIEILLAEVAEQ